MNVTRCGILGACVFLGLAETTRVLAGDVDADGVRDTRDICNNTPAGVAVDFWGRPYADFDQDCDVGLADYAFFAEQFTGVLSPPQQAGEPDADDDADGVNNDTDVCDNTPAGIAVDYWGRPYADLDHDCDVDTAEYAFFQAQFTGEMAGCLEGAPCDDGSACTVNDVCMGNVCIGEPIDATCDDGAYCNGAERCDVVAGCVAGDPVDCSSLDDTCNAGFCNETTDTCITLPANEGGQCDDGLFCSVGEQCAGGACVSGAARDCSAQDGECLVGVCDEADDVCIAEPAHEGENCDDGLFCTVGESCLQGACAGGGERDCSFLNEGCVVGACDESADMCVEDALPNGFGCNDGSPCTIGDTCSNGVCGGIMLADQTSCDDGDPGTPRSICVTGTCLASTVYTPSITISYDCSAGDIAFEVAAFEFVDAGGVLTVFGAPAMMTGPGNVGPGGSFEVAGSIEENGCTQTFTLDGQFNGAAWEGSFRARFSGCGSCSWPTWNGISGIPE